MIRLVSVVLVTAIFTSLCFAQEVLVPPGIDKNGELTPLSDNATSFVPDVTITFTGRINYVSSAYIMSGAGRQINVIDDNGLETIFVVARDIIITGKDGKATTLNWLSRDDKVSLEYFTNMNGIKMVKSIKVLPGW